jgi:hypothetical protein
MRVCIEQILNSTPVQPVPGETEVLFGWLFRGAAANIPLFSHAGSIINVITPADNFDTNKSS